MADKSWIKNYGNMPVPQGTLVDVRYRDGAVSYNQPAGVRGRRGECWAYAWTNTDHIGDIMEWRFAVPADGPIQWEDMCEGDVVRFVRCIPEPTGQDHNHWGYRVLVERKES